MESKQEMNGKFSVESRLADLGFPVEDDEERWEEKENGYLYLHSPSIRTIYCVDPKSKNFGHRGTGRGCFYTDWEVI